VRSEKQDGTVREGEGGEGARKKRDLDGPIVIKRGSTRSNLSILGREGQMGRDHGTNTWQKLTKRALCLLCRAGLFVTGKKAIRGRGERKEPEGGVLRDLFKGGLVQGKCRGGNHAWADVSSSQRAE